MHCDYVSPQKLINALKWLKANNPLYADVDIADDWVQSAIADDEDLVMSMLEQPESMEDDGNPDITCSLLVSATSLQPNAVPMLSIANWHVNEMVVVVTIRHWYHMLYLVHGIAQCTYQLRVNGHMSSCTSPYIAVLL